MTPTDSTSPPGSSERDGHTGGLAAAVGADAGDEVERERPLEHVDAGGDGRLVERALDLGAAAVAAGVDDAVAAVAALAGQRRTGAVGAGVERRAEAHQVADRRRRLGDELAHDAPRRTGRRRRRACRGRAPRTSRVGSSTPARPPCAHAVEPALSTSLVTISTLRTGRTASAAASPAAPEPSTTTSTSRSQVGAGAASAARDHALLARRRRLADGDHPLDRAPGPVGDVGAARRRRRCRRATSAAAWPA